MKQGFLSNYFEGVAAKRLSLTEIDPETSHGHEFQGVNNLKKILGPERKFTANFIYLGDSEENTLTAQGQVTWYDARKGQVERSPEFRLFYSYSSDLIATSAKESDLLIIGIRPDKTLMIVIVKSGSTFESQLIWLLGLPETLNDKYNVDQIADKTDRLLNFASKFILDELGIEIERTG